MFKKLVSILLVSLLVSSNLTVYAADIQNGSVQTQDEALVLPKRIENEIYSSIVQVYGEKQAKEIYDRVMQIARTSIEKRPEYLKKEDLSRPDDWYKDEIIYMFYVDQFGVVTPEKPNTFKDTSAMFDYLKDLGVTTLYLLPFADSPMSDAGFDVKNPRNIRADLGGKAEFKDFVIEAKKNGFKIKSDLVLNHISDEHEWFQAFLRGDVSKKDYFVEAAVEEPELIEEEIIEEILESKEEPIIEPEAVKIQEKPVENTEIAEEEYKKIEYTPDTQNNLQDILENIIAQNITPEVVVKKVAAPREHVKPQKNGQQKKAAPKSPLQEYLNAIEVIAAVEKKAPQFKILQNGKRMDVKVIDENCFVVGETIYRWGDILYLKD